MTACLKGKKSATSEARKLMLKQITKSQRCVRAVRVDDSALHTARKRIKMARATLRLLHRVLPTSQYRAENERLRDAARPLSQARDAVALLQQFDRFLTQRGPGHRALRGAAGLRRDLVAERRQARHVLDTRGLPNARQCLSAAAARASRWHLPGKNWSALGSGVRSSYRNGCDALEAVKRKRTDEALHEWRKQAKYLRHQLQLLQPTWPRTLKSLAAGLHELTDLLGDDHDLAVLRAKAMSNPSLARRDTGPSVFARLDTQRSSLQRRALALGARLYSDKPTKFAKRLHRHWRQWH